MNEQIKWIWVALVFVVAVVTFLLWMKYGTCPGKKTAKTGSVLADQSFPFNASEFLARAGRPFCTVFEFVVDSGNNPRVDLTSFTLSSAEGENALAGDYIVPKKETDSTKFTFANTSQSITIDFTKRPEGGLTMERGVPVSIVVPALPRSFNDLSITFTGNPIGRKTLKLRYKDGTPLAFKAHNRHRIYGLSLPDCKTK